MLKDNIVRLDGNHLSVEDFIDKYESKYIPCVVTNLTNTWPATEKWTLKVKKLT